LITGAILLFGPLFSGKSLFVERLADSLRGEGIAVAGFVQRGVFDAGGDKIGYDLVGLSSGAQRPLARRSKVGRGWRFDEAAFEVAREEVRSSAFTIIDEIGPLELDGRGHAAAVERALTLPGAVLVVVREALVERARRWLSSYTPVEVVRFEPGRDEEIAAKIRERFSL